MKKNFISILLVTILLTTLVPTVALGSAPASGKLMLYSSLPVTQLDLMIDMFNEKYPNITVDVFSADSADVFARAQAEAGATGGLVLGGNLESFRSAQNLFTAYTTSNAKNFHEQYASVENAAFTPIQLHVSALLVNQALAKELGVKVMSWESLKDEKLSGRVAYMNPASSSPVSEQTSFVTNFAKTINVASPSAPSFVLNAVTAGQYAVGIVNEEKAIERQLSGANVDVVYAAEGVAMGASYAGILSGAQNEENAKLFLDFITGREYQQAAADILHQRSVRRDVDFGLKGIASTKNLKALDFESMALLTRLQTAAR
jgi:iron(III) transport system substrate-binding protein